MQEQKPSLHTQYDQPIQKIQQLNQMLQKLASQQSLEDLADQTSSQEYLQLLASMIYSLNSVMYSYCQVKGQQLPQQFKKVKQYYSKVKDTLAGKQSNQKQYNSTKIDKQAAQRLIRAGLNQNSNN